MGSLSLKNWLHAETKETIFINLIVFLLFFGISSNINNAYVSIPMGLAWFYLLYDSIKAKSLEGFYMPRENWLGTVVFLLSVITASCLLGDPQSIHIAFKYVYWCVPLLTVWYLAKRTDFLYAAIAGIWFSIAVAAVNIEYLYQLYLKGEYIGFIPGRIGAFDAHPNLYAVLLAGSVPLAVLSLAAEKVKTNKILLGVNLIVIVLAFHSLLRTASRGAMLGCVVGLIGVLFVYYSNRYSLKKLLAGLILLMVLFAAFAKMGLPSGMSRGYDNERILFWKASYAMWQDHKLIGVGLNNWHDKYVNKYITEEAKERMQVSPHNSFAWFFSTTGVIGGIGYLYLLFYYSSLLVHKIKRTPIQWVLYVGLWSFLAINIHGMVDMGVTNKAAARLLFLMLGLAMSRRYENEQEKYRKSEDNLI
ncbi:MAG: O-antigen ligase family protein [Acidaminococcaceae bacterium]|nr:O-antigen ligase family protein [Acidaminococcaceae bacterium]